MESTENKDESFITLWSSPFFESLTPKQSSEILTWVVSNCEARTHSLLQSTGLSIEDALKLPMDDNVSERLWRYLLNNSTLVELSKVELGKRQAFLSAFMGAFGKRTFDEEKIRSIVFGSGTTLSTHSLTTAFNVAMLVSMAFKAKYHWVDWYIEKNKKRSNFNTPTLWMTGKPGSYMDFVSSIRVGLLSYLEHRTLKNTLKDHTDFLCKTLEEVAQYNNL